MSEMLMAPFIGVFFATAVYLILSKSVIRMLLGITILGNGVNLLIFIMGRVTRDIPPIVPAGLKQPIGDIANPLPQALILTAIVIGFALFTFLLVLGYRAYQELDADNTDNMRLAEPPNPPQPPLSY
ncbi:MAG: Na+/H+ antiporter subunit C [Devosiaceae bacterium]|nr:Na+/H+ antiporter subunit C [Devosiaceae bacterium]